MVMKPVIRGGQAESIKMTRVLTVRMKNNLGFFRDESSGKDVQQKDGQIKFRSYRLST